MIKKTKIVATIGPGSEDKDKIEGIIKAGADILRLNIKHNTLKWHAATATRAQEVAGRLGINIGIMADIPNINQKIDGVEANFIALSEVRSHKEIEKLRKILTKNKNQVLVVAKIETIEAVSDIEAIAEISDGVMIARGDLGEQIELKELAFWQKKIIEVCRDKSVPVIVATQMLTSMVNSKRPTRAEATDVANAVFDGTDALMLSEETAIGNFPVESVAEMAAIAQFSENKSEYIRLEKRGADSAIESLVAAAAEVIKNQKGRVGAAIVFSRSGRTVRVMSSYRPDVPIIGISNSRETVESFNLSYGVIPYWADLDEGKFDIEGPIFEKLKKEGLIKKGDLIVVVHGNNWISQGATSNISLLEA